MKLSAPPPRLFVVKWRSPQGTKTLNDVFRCMASGVVTRKETSSITENKTAQQPSRPARHNVRSCNSCNHITSTITGRRQVILHFITHGLRRSACIVLLSCVTRQPLLSSRSSLREPIGIALCRFRSIHRLRFEATWPFLFLSNSDQLLPEPQRFLLR